MGVYPVVLSQAKFVHRDSLKYPFEERGLQFGDGIYEVIRIYRGNYYLLTEHVERLFRSAKAIKLELPYTKTELTELLNGLIKRNQMTEDGKVYLQATRGSAPRDHVFPENLTANVYAYISKQARPLNQLEHGVCTITERDIRWEKCYIKSLNLLPNILAKQTAKEKECYEAILHKDGLVTECSSSNVYLVKDGHIYTHPVTENILHGCVRMAVERFSEKLNIPFIEEAFTLEDIKSADELFLTSSTSEVLPIVKVDGAPVADGKPGPISKKLQAAYEQDASIQTETVKQ
ncbi:MAG TPA: D-amino-acid transaminase [Cerasibacillus sp.]|uniref:D-amino-acid transaminase n=1 Tax=Cerasibacillus sp. TaxID=2498711 RepID=UPI002F4179AF